LLDGWTHQAQYLEGQILKKVMLQRVVTNIVYRPDDAIAVQQKHRLWAEKAIGASWTQAVCEAAPRMKMDKPI
jgi:hypothetical protein